jgi:hypothetical protein
MDASELLTPLRYPPNVPDDIVEPANCTTLPPEHFYGLEGTPPLLELDLVNIFPCTLAKQ